MVSEENLIINIDNKNRYERTRKRLARFNYAISDKEIIEKLDEEIEQYRNKIKKLTEQLTQSKEVILDVTEELEDKDIVEIISTTQYADGKPIISKMEYKYKENDNKQEQSTCPPIEIGMTKAY